MALNGLNTRIVRIAVKFKFSICKQYSNAPATTMKKSKRFHESAKYVFLPYIPIAIILIVISNAKNAKIISSNILMFQKKKKKRTIFYKYFSNIFICLFGLLFTCKILHRFVTQSSSTQG